MEGSPRHLFLDGKVIWMKFKKSIIIFLQGDERKQGF
jgi:hypothetical protein